MATYLLSYDEKDWDESALSKLIDAYKYGDTKHRWKIKTKKAIGGERIFLIKRGRGVRGLFGSGHIISDQPFTENDFKGKSSTFVMVEFDYLSHPRERILIDRDTLFQFFPENHWDAQGSGNSINSSITAALEKMWLERIGGAEISYPDEFRADEKFIEGSRKKVYVNSYERDSTARQKCIQHYGESCEVCGFHFDYFYGSLGKGYIHVHHLKPISSIGEEYEVDPIKDLRPVCPNCHAMLHKGKDPISIEELQTLVSLYGKHPRMK